MVLLLTTLVKQELMKTLFTLLLTSLLFSCFVPRSKRVQPLEYMPVYYSQINDSLYNLESAPIRIDSVALNNNIITFFYTSTFNPGKLGLVGSSMLAKSFPPIRNCKIRVEEQNATKKNNSNQTYNGIAQFNLRALSHKFVKDAPTYLQIQGWPEKILFIYND